MQRSLPLSSRSCSCRRVPRVALITTSYPAFPGDPCGHFVETEARLLARGGEVVVITAAAGAQAGVQTDAGRPRADDAGVVVWRLHGGDAFGWPGLAARVRERPSRLASVLLWARRARAVVRSLPPFDRVVAHWAIPSALTFFQNLEPGMYRVSYLARATAIGTFVTPPTRLEAMYSPEVFGRTAASVLAVHAKL